MELVLVRGRFLANRHCLNIAFSRFLQNPLTLGINSSKNMSTSDDWKDKKTFYEFSATDIDGNLV